MFDNEPRWRRSSSCGNETECVEFSKGGELAMVRDSKNLRGPVLNFPSKAWDRFVEFVANGDESD
ncbi:DUF397 domain-containing protein [Streptomyces sp. NPDC023998]|uniref:DUF397 domain-containing protein n=1 Tax=Streptomyces sp. NPDC023998 TaxID=3154597 RepID=UPI0033E1EEDA